MSAPALDSTKLYAWRVVARNNSMPVATSEVWSFNLKRHPTEKVEPNAAGYARLGPDIGEVFVITHGQLNYAYLNEKNVRSAEIAVWDITGGARRPVALDTDTCALRYGDNLLTLDLRTTGGMTDGHFYLFQLTDADSKRWYVKFQFKHN